MHEETAALLGWIGLGLGAVAIAGMALLALNWARYRRWRPEPQRHRPEPVAGEDWRDDAPPGFFERMERRERVLERVTSPERRAA